MLDTWTQCVEPFDPGRWDAEYYTSPYRGFLDDLFTGWPEWEALGSVATRLNTGHTPLRHDLDDGDVEFITVECVDSLYLDRSKTKRVTSEQAAGELKRARLKAGDVLVTIKRRLVNSSPVYEAHEMVVNQDVAVMTPREGLLPGFVSAVLESRIGKYQAFRNQTEQINPYLSLTNLKELQIPIVPEEDQAPIDALVRERLNVLRSARLRELEARQILAEALQLQTLASPSLSAVVPFSRAIDLTRADAEYFCAPTLADEWESPYDTIPLSDPRIAKSINAGITPAAADYSDEGKPIIKVGGLSAFCTAEWLGDFVKNDAVAAKGNRNRLQTGDVLLLAAAHHVSYIGKCGIVESVPPSEDWRAVAELLIVRPGGLLNPETLATYLNLPAVRQEVQKGVRGQSAHLYPGDLGSVPVPLVPTTVQEQVKAKFDEGRVLRARANELSDEAKAAAESIILDPGRETTSDGGKDVVSPDSRRKTPPD